MTDMTMPSNTGTTTETIQVSALQIDKEHLTEVTTHILSAVPEESMKKLLSHLLARLDTGATARNARVGRFAKVDKLVSTWQQLDPKDSQREAIEDKTGNSSALPMNIPMLATYLSDATSYFSEALAPISSPFFSSKGSEDVKPLIKRLNQDATARDYYGQLTNTIKSLLKYNIGGLHVDWFEGVEKGNVWTSIDMYNVLYDPTIRNPVDISLKAEFSATVSLTNRMELIKKRLASEWYGLDDIIDTYKSDSELHKYYREASASASINNDGQDGRSSNKTNQSINYADWGLGLSSDGGVELAGYELIDMYVWLVPEQYALLTENDQSILDSAGINPETFLQRWRFKIINGTHIVDAESAPIEQAIEASSGAATTPIPHYMCWLTDDELREAQRSLVELQKNFQRFGSAMLNIYIAGMRKSVWGTTAVDPSMFDTKNLEGGEVAGIIKSREPGRDVRTGISNLTLQGNLEGAIQGVDHIMALRDKFFPSQQLPSQVAGIDRAVKSQVAAVVQGGSRALKMLLRQVDSRMLGPSRLAAYRNLKSYDSDGLEAVTDEAVSQLVGSGIEAIEAERVSEALWQLLYAVIQNQETMQKFDVPDIMSYLSRVMNISVDLGTFVRQTATPTAGQEQDGAEASDVNPATFNQPTK